jgi:glycerate 2-kinase
VIVALGAYKGFLTSGVAGRLVAEEVRTHDPRLAPTVLPLGDGGEGTLEAMSHYFGGRWTTEVVVGPLGDPIKAPLLWLNQSTAAIESAAVVGYSLLPEQKRDPWRASSEGVGELIVRAKEQGARRIYVTMGDSVVMDMGLGALRALGVRMLDAYGLEVRISSLLDAHNIVSLAVPSGSLDLSLVVLSDTLDQVIGPHDQVSAYGAQKGLALDDVGPMSRVTRHVAGMLEGSFGMPVASIPLSSGSGGLAAALHGLFHAPLEHCVPWLFSRTGIDRLIRSADIVITGEGRLDSQTRWGKVPWMVSALRPARLIVLAGGADVDGIADIDDAMAGGLVDVITVPADGREGKHWAKEAGARLAEIL